MNTAMFFSLAAQMPLPVTQAANNIDVLVQKDPFGGIMALIGMGIVFTALLLLYIIFSNTPVLFTFSFRQKLKKALYVSKNHETEESKAAEKPQEDLSGEVSAAIAVAIHLYRSELHDFEDTVLTIKKVSRTYSPWSSKIYGLRNPLPNQ